ncbi:MAG: hypothetical protein LBG98_02140 [Puniceicoccales bacterium]|jgi:hypothetical protein|nr:hypothetical protein [Puniceicoccales bacterium]
MQTVKAYFDGNVFVPVEHIQATKNQKAVVMLLDDIPQSNTGKTYLRYAGALSDESYSEIEAILQDTRRVDINEWQRYRHSW